MNENLIELLVWIITYEMNNMESNDKHKELFKKINEIIFEFCELRHKRNNFEDVYTSHIDLGHKMHNFYYSHFIESMPGNNYAQKYIQRLQNGRYENEFDEIKFIASGKFGKVFMARNKQDQHHYAIKKLKYSETLSEYFADRILREIRVWTKLIQSRYFVQYVTSWSEKHTQEENIALEEGDSWDKTSENKSMIENDNNENKIIGRVLYIQTELCQMNLNDAIDIIGKELNQSVGKPITVIGLFIATQILNEIVAGLNFLHLSGIIHRDIKPKNIFLTDGKDGTFIKIGDFGLATFRSDPEILPVEVNSLRTNNELSQGVGTPEYMAPEVINSSNYNEKCDIYSLGCIIMDLLFVDKQERHNMDGLTRALLNSTSEVSKFDSISYNITRLLWIVQHCVNKFAERRITSNSLVYKSDWLISIEDLSAWDLIQNFYDVVLREDLLNKEEMRPLSDYIVLQKLMRNKEKEILQKPWVRDDREKMQISMNLCKQSSKIYSGSYIDSTYLESEVKNIHEFFEKLYSIHSSPESIGNFALEYLEEYSENWDFSEVSMFHSSSIKFIVWKPLKYFYTYFPWDENSRSILIFFEYIDEDTPLPHKLISRKNGDVIITSLFDDKTTNLIINELRETKESEINKKIKKLIGNKNAIIYYSKRENSLLIYEEVYKIKDRDSHLQLNLKCEFAAKIDKLCFALFTYDFVGDIIHKFKSLENTNGQKIITNLEIYELGPPPSKLLMGSQISFV